MATAFKDIPTGLTQQNNHPLDGRTYYDTIEEALADNPYTVTLSPTPLDPSRTIIETARFIGQKMVIVNPPNSDSPCEYWFKDGIEDKDLIEYHCCDCNSTGAALRITGQIAACGYHYTANLVYRIGGTPLTNLGKNGSPPESVPFNVWGKVKDHYEDYAYTPKDLDIWQNLTNKTFWIWKNGKWCQILDKYLTNTTISENSVGVTDYAALAVTNNANLMMNDRTNLELRNSGSIKVSDSANISLHEAANIDLGNSAKLYAKGAGAISGLQGSAIGGNKLYENGRVYLLTKDLSLTGLDIQLNVFDSFLVNDIFYFIAEKTLEGAIFLSYLDIDGNEVSEKIDNSNSVTLILLSKENGVMKFKKLSDTVALDFSEGVYTQQSYSSAELKYGTLTLKSGRDLTTELEINSAKISQSKETFENGSKKITEEKSCLVEDLIDIAKGDKIPPALSKGTRNQIVLGNGEMTPEETEDEEEFNAASSLFAEGGVMNDAPDVLYGEFRNKGLRIGWDNVVDLIFNEVFDRLNEFGLLGGGGGSFDLIASVALAIPVPVHGKLLANEVSITNNDPRYYTGTIVWEPDDGIASGLKSYKAVFTIAPKFGFQFHPATAILVNGEPPSSAEMQTDWSILITVDFAPTGNVPIDEITLTFDEPTDGENPND
ncbi:MAG: hypothetical protein LBC64_09650 [Fibromonadaceae bacterium]|jgi:hypothetical protein|nr:hypothetical protein [Fibromonadaceae bacterium]